MLHQKQDNVTHSMSLNSILFCVCGTSTFRFEKYFQTVFELMELNITPTFKKMVNTETINSNKNHSSKNMM